MLNHPKEETVDISRLDQVDKSHYRSFQEFYLSRDFVSKNNDRISFHHAPETSQARYIRPSLLKNRVDYDEIGLGAQVDHKE